MKKLNKVFILTLLGLMLRSSSLMAQDARWNFEVIGGAPYMLSNVKASQQSLYGGAGLRYSISPLLSAQFQFNGGVMAGDRNVTGTYFTYNFMQYTFRGIVNVSSLINKPKALSRFNAYVYLGGGYIKCYSKTNAYSSNQDRIGFDGNNSLFFVSNLGLNIKYYVNEYIDLIGGSEFNFTRTNSLANNPNRNEYDKFALNYIGISFKILPSSVKTQNPDWIGMKLPYDNYDEMLKISQAKAAAAEAKSQLAVKEAKTMMAEADSKIARAEEYSQNVISKISSVKGQLDTLKEMITFIKEKGTFNNMNINQDNDQNPDNIPAAPSAPSYRNFTKDTKPSKNTIAKSNTEIKAQKNMSAPIMSYVSEKEPVRTIDMNKKFAVVLGSFVKYENAVNAKKQLADKGYQVDLVNFDDPNVQRLVIYCDNKEVAQKQLSELRETENSEAWMLTINQLIISSK